MADFVQANGTARWRTDRSRSEPAATPTDPDTLRELAAAKVEQRAAQAADRQNAMIEYEANRRALQANTERLRALRIERDEAAKLAKARPVKAKRAIKIAAPRT